VVRILRLTYTSSRRHDERVDRLRRKPEAFAALVGDPRGVSLSDLVLALKALRYGRD
jgi:hypothetical protein